MSHAEDPIPEGLTAEEVEKFSGRGHLIAGIAAVEIEGARDPRLAALYLSRAVEGLLIGAVGMFVDGRGTEVGPGLEGLSRFLSITLSNVERWYAEQGIPLKISISVSGGKA